MTKNLILVIATGLICQAHSQTPVKTTTLTPAQTADACYRKGLLAEKAGDPEAAIEAYTAALKANPNHANARYSLGQIKINSAAVAAKGREMKFGAVQVPEYKLDGATLQESLEALRMIVEKESKNAVAPNFIIKDTGGKLAATKITLVLKNLPAKAVLKYVLDQASAKARFDEHAIVIEPK